MEARVDEIAPQIFRIAVWTGKAPITFNQFVIRDAFPALIHTGHAALFDTVRAQVERLLDPRTLRYISFSHFEADECGALNHWLTLAPQAAVQRRAITLNDPIPWLRPLGRSRCSRDQ
jgi:flavorubredoxin